MAREPAPAPSPIPGAVIPTIASPVVITTSGGVRRIHGTLRCRRFATTATATGIVPSTSATADGPIIWIALAAAR